MTTRLTGLAAIAHAQDHGLTLGKYADPTEGDRVGLTVAEAREVASQDPSLLYLDVEDEGEGEDETSTDTPHVHAPYSARGHVTRCICGARREWSRDGWTWTDDGTRACAACGADTLPGATLCAWHTLIS